MEKMNKIWSLFAGLMLTMSIVSCEDLAFGERFLQKPPSTDVTIDTIFGKAEYARRVLWRSYQYLPYGMETNGFWTQMCMRIIRESMHIERKCSSLNRAFGQVCAMLGCYMRT